MYRYVMRLLSLITLSCFFAPLAASGIDESGVLTVEEIVERAVGRSEAQIKSNVAARFEALVLTTIMSFNGDGEITGTERSLYSKYPLYGALYEELIEKEGKPLTEEETRGEEKKRDKFIKEVKNRMAEGKDPQPEDEQRVRFDREFMQRYQTSLIGTENLRGYSCWVVCFEPKEGKLPVRRRMDEALNKSTGKIWVSKDDFGLVRAEFEMREPIRYLGGLLATVRNTVGKLEFERIESEIWFPSDFEIKLDMRILFKNIRRHIAMNWSEYQRSDPGFVPPISSRVSE